MKKLKIIIFMLTIVMIISCNNSKDVRSINQSSLSTKEMENLVVAKGDSTAYYELFYTFVDNDKQDSELLYYSYIMAFKYNYPKAYMDVFNILCNMYDIDPTDENINLNKMDIQSRELAINCLKKASENNYLDAKKYYQNILKYNKE